MSYNGCGGGYCSGGSVGYSAPSIGYSSCASGGLEYKISNSEVSAPSGPEVINLDAIGKTSYNNNDNYANLYLTNHYQRDRKSTRLNSSHIPLSRMPSSA